MEEEEGIHFSLRDVVQVAAGPGRWAVLVSRLDDEDGTIDPRALILSLDADGTRIDTKLLELPMLGGGELLWAEGRWAVATESLDGDVAHVRAQLFDREFRAATPVLELGPTHPSSLALVRLTHLDRWVALRNEDGALAMSPFREDRVELPVHATTPLDTPTLHAVGLRSRMALLLGHPPGASVPSELAAHSGSRPFSGRRVPTGLVIDPVEHAAAVASLRDNVVLVASGGGRTAVHVFDAFEVWPFRAAQPLAAEQSASVDVAGSSKFGVAGACYALSNGDTHQVRFQLISLDGRLQGVGVDIGASQRGLCTVGHDDLGFLVAWWDGAELWVRRVFVAS
jgi:hypothetical protein